MCVERRPRDPDSFSVEVHLPAVGLGEQVCHESDQVSRGQAASGLHPRVGFQLESRERRHDEEVSVEIGHGLFEQGNAEISIGLGLEEVRADERLVEVRCNLGKKDRIARVDERLGSPCIVRVERVAELVRERAEAPEVIAVAHDDERMGTYRSG